MNAALVEKKFSLAVFFGVICISATATVASGQSATMLSVQVGAFTEEQAIRGQSIYLNQCWQCHGEALSGLDQASPLAGPQFSSTWEGEPLWELVIRIDTMPPDKPGSLSRAENVDVLTYILWYNGLPIGETPLANEQSVLTNMTFQVPPLTVR